MTVQQRAKAVVIGASAGALEALSGVLPGLPADFPLPIMIVVHIPPDRESILASLLAVKCKLPVHEAEDKETVMPGHIYIAPPDYHLQVEEDGALSLSSEEPVLFSRPSIDILFETAADVYGDSLIGIILTGANNDGARGLKAVVDAGGIALVQDPQQALNTLMPKSAIDACPSARVLSLEGIVSYLKGAVA